MEQVLFTYEKAMLGFLITLYIFYALTIWRMRRSSAFLPKLLGGGAAVLAIALAMAVAYQVWGQTAVGRSVIYLVLFGVSMAHVQLCFAEGFPAILFCCSVAYAAQNLCYKIHLMVWCGWTMHLSASWGMQFYRYYDLLYYAYFLVAAVVVYGVFIYPMVRGMSSWQLDRRLMAIALMILAVTVILCSVEDVYFGKLSLGMENHFQRPELLVLRQTGNLFSVMCCVSVLLLASRTVEHRELEQEVEYLHHAIRQSERQYEISRDTIELINIKCHDIRYKLQALAAQGGAVPRQAVEDLQKSISIYDAKIATGNQLLDVLLTEKSLYCEQNGIELSCMVDGAGLAFMEGSDLYCLFGNVLDNALEAVKAIADRERRVINLVVKVRGNMVVIQQDNYFDGRLTFREGLPMTTKQDKGYHGFGMRSIRMIVHKYDGELTACIKDDIFHLNILFSLNNQ